MDFQEKLITIFLFIDPILLIRFIVDIIILIAFWKRIRFKRELIQLLVYFSEEWMRYYILGLVLQDPYQALP